MEKNFKTWTKSKQAIHLFKKRAMFKEREIFYAKLGTNIGFEQDGKNENFLRPVLILRKFNNEIAIILPLTTVKKDNSFHFECSFNDTKKSYAILSQIRLIDSKRLMNKIGKIQHEKFIELKKQLSVILQL